MEKVRCSWAGTDPLYCAYHDVEWGCAVHEDTKLFEFLILEGFQAGLSWLTILRKRESFTKAFAHWDYRRIARFDDTDIDALMHNAGIVRNSLKIKAAITNARCFLAVQKEWGSFDRYLWSFTNNTTLCSRPRYTALNQLPSRTSESDALSKDLKKRGFSFVGTTICYAFMQAIGMVDDHEATCFKAAD